MNKKPVELTRDQLIDTILEIPSIKERGWALFDLAGHSNHDLVALYEKEAENPCKITVKFEPFVPVVQETYGYI